ncbi:MAG TPA: GldM family protein, partial [Saprospiraceae bacterium]|nr:GldM family protein [Saprospiraceae bacterium]
MSIPKEPRQLMINIMYLVLTALLALNVSAEIFNAFKVVDKSMVKSNLALDEANGKMPQAIKDGAKKRESLAVYAERVDPARQYAAELDQYIQNIIDTMITSTGAYMPDPETGEMTDHLKGEKNKDVTTRILVDKGVGEELKAKILEYREKFISLLDTADRATYSKDIALAVDDETWKTKKKKSWSEMNFNHMPLQAALPILRKFQNDVKNSEATILNYLANKVGTTTDVVLDKFTVVSAAKKSYVIKGETYEADIFLSAFAGADSKTGISISVDGRSLPVDAEGVAKYTASASGVGLRKYSASINVTNPVTNEVQTFKKEFEYEVGERSVSVSATKMNVFYIGVDNPVAVSAAGVPSNQVQVSMTGAGGGSISKNSDGTYNVKVSQQTKLGEFAYVTVSAPGLSEKREFRVKRIPNPVAKLSSSMGGVMSSGEFKAQRGLFAVLENFDFDAKCEIMGYQLVRVPRRQDPQMEANKGGGYNAGPKGLVDQAKAGDTFYFENVKAKCPGDASGRDINQLVFKIN